MSARPARKLSPETVIAMLDDLKFCNDARRVIAEAKVLREHATSYEQFEEQVMALGQPFRDRWGVWPPQTGELLDADPRRRAVEAIASGNWGIVSVFPWTTDRDIHAWIKTIRNTISKWHKDSLNFHTTQLERWLEDCGAGFDRKAIVRAVRRRTTALRRPTTSQAFARADRETPGLADELFEKYRQQYRELGIGEDDAYRLANQRVERALRGSEAPAHAALRMAGSRYLNRLNELNTDLATPITSEPLSHALTTLFRGLDEDDATVQQHAAAVKGVFLGDPSEPLAPGQSSTGRPRIRQIDAIESGQWGVVPVFPWTTNPDVRALVTSVRIRIRTPRRDPGHPTQAASPSPESDQYSPALMRLFGSLAQEDDAAVKRHARAVLASFLTAQPS